MAKKKESLLLPIASELISEVWQQRVDIILRDLSELPHLRYVYVLGKDGTKLTKTVGADTQVQTEPTANPEIFAHLAKIVEEYLVNLEHPSPAHLLVEMSEELLFVGSTGEVILVACFDGGAPRGYMSMKLSKRVNHLRRLFRTMEKYV